MADPKQAALAEGTAEKLQTDGEFDAITAGESAGQEYQSAAHHGARAAGVTGALFHAPELSAGSSNAIVMLCDHSSCSLTNLGHIVWKSVAVVVAGGMQPCTKARNVIVASPYILGIAVAPLDDA